MPQQLWCLVSEVSLVPVVSLAHGTPGACGVPGACGAPGACVCFWCLWCYLYPWCPWCLWCHWYLWCPLYLWCPWFLWCLWCLCVPGACGVPGDCGVPVACVSLVPVVPPGTSDTIGTIIIGTTITKGIQCISGNRPISRLLHEVVNNPKLSLQQLDGRKIANRLQDQMQLFQTGHIGAVLAAAIGQGTGQGKGRCPYKNSSYLWVQEFQLTVNTASSSDTGNR